MISPPAAPVAYSVAYPDLYDLWSGSQLWTGILLASRPFWWHNTAERFKKGWLGWRAGLGFGGRPRRTPLSTHFWDATLAKRGLQHG